MDDHWEHFDHGADIGVRGFGATKAAAFEQAALALIAVITDPSRVAARETGADRLQGRRRRVAAGSLAQRDRLRDGRPAHAVRTLPCRAARRRRLQATAGGEPMSVERHEPAVEVKGATYTALRVARTGDGGWMAQTVVDV